MTTPIDIEARKQLLLTRIALERVQWARDVQSVQTAASPSKLAARAIRAAVPDKLLKSIFGPTPAGQRNQSRASNLGMRAFHAMMLWRRYSILITFVAGLVARMVAGRRIHRVALVGTFVAASVGGIWLTLMRRRHTG
jgi:hypothetical protein